MDFPWSDPGKGPHPVLSFKSGIKTKPKSRERNPVLLNFGASYDQRVVHLGLLVEIHEQANPVHLQFEPYLGRHGLYPPNSLRSKKRRVSPPMKG